MCEGMKALETFVGAKPLLKQLLLQMDKCVKDNKNQHLFILCHY
jgi:hypothetical protein